MNAITLHSPWAELIAYGGKQIETRSWPAPASAIGQPIAIHSGKTFHEYAHEWLIDSEEAQAVFAGAKISPYTGLPGDFRWKNVGELRFLENADSKFLFGHTRGCVLAVATLAGCYRMTQRPGIDGACLYDPKTKRAVYPSLEERAFGDWSPGRYAWVLSDVVRLPQPIPTRGYQQVWQWDAPQSVLDMLPALTGATESAA